MSQEPLALYRAPAEGPPIGLGRSNADLIGEALGAGAQVVVIPTARLEPAFFDLRSGIAGELLQKLVNYRMRVVILGDCSAAAARSVALGDLVRESNRGEHVCFLDSEAELAAWLSRVNWAPGHKM